MVKDLVQNKSTATSPKVCVAISIDFAESA